MLSRQVQTIEDIYQLVRTAVASKKPIEAISDKGASAVLSAPTRPESRRRTAGVVKERSLEEGQPDLQTLDCVDY